MFDVQGYQTVDNGVVLNLSGSFVQQETAELRRTFHRWLGFYPRLVVLDMAGVRTIDSAALGLLIALKNSVEKLGGRLVLCALPSKILQTFETTNLLSYFIVVGTQAQALVFRSQPITY